MTEGTIDLATLLAATTCPFCDHPLGLGPIFVEIVCTCCSRPMWACPARFTGCPACGGASLDTTHCDLCGEPITPIDPKIQRWKAARARRTPK